MSMQVMYCIIFYDVAWPRKLDAFQMSFVAVSKVFKCFWIDIWTRCIFSGLSFRSKITSYFVSTAIFGVISEREILEGFFSSAYESSKIFCCRVFCWKFSSKGCKILIKLLSIFKITMVVNANVRYNYTRMNTNKIITHDNTKYLVINSQSIDSL